MNRKIAINGVGYPCAEYQVSEYSRDIEYEWGPNGIRWDWGLGKSYLTSDGWDATSPDRLRLSPGIISYNVPEFTQRNGSFYETDKRTGAVVYDATATTKGTGALSVAHTVTSSATNRLLVIAIAVDTLSAADYAAGTVTYGGVACDWRESSTTGTLGWMIFYLAEGGIANAASTTVAYSNPNGRSAVMHTISFSNVLQVDPFGNVAESTGTGTAVSTSVSALPSWLILDIVASANATATVGADQTQRQNDIQGTAVRAAISTQEATTSLAMTWTLGSSVAWKHGAVGILPAQTQAVLFTADGEWVHKHTYDGATTISEVTAPVQTASAEYAGKFALWSGKLYLGAGSSVPAYWITPGATTDTYTATNWYAVDLTTFQDAATPELAASDYDQTVHRIGVASLATGTGSSGELALADFSTHGDIGDPGQAITAIVEVGGFIVVAKKEGLYEIDSQQIGRLIVKVPPYWENGFGTIAIGDIVLYPTNSGLWLYRVGRDVSQQGIEVLDLPRPTNTGLTSICLLDRRPVTPVQCGDWVYYAQVSTQKGAIIAARPRRGPDPPGHDFVQHMLWDTDRWNGGHFDFGGRFWMKGATAQPSTRDISLIHLNLDGSPSGSSYRGMTSTAHTIAFLDGEGQFVRPTPGRACQLRHCEVITANGFGASTSLQVGMYRDSVNAVTAIGSAITADTATNAAEFASTGKGYELYPTPATVGTGDIAERWIPVLTMTTNGDYAPASQDPWVLMFKAVWRTPQVYRVVIPADDLSLEPFGVRANTARKNLQRLMQRGPVDIDPPENYVDTGTFGTNWKGEVIRCDETWLTTEQGGGRAIAVYIKRWVTD